MILLLPAPLGPTIQVNPEESFTVTVRSPKDLNPVIEIFLIYVRVRSPFLDYLLNKKSKYMLKIFFKDRDGGRISFKGNLNV
jgi:hypothetical protein